MNIADILLNIVVFERHFPAAGDQRIFADRPVRMVGVGYRVAPLVAVLVSQIPGVLFAQVIHCVPIPRTTPQERQIVVGVAHRALLPFAACSSDAFFRLGQQFQLPGINIP